MDECEIKALLASMKITCRSKPNWWAGIEAVASGKPVSLTAFESAEIRSYVRDTLSTRPIDYIFVFSGQMAQYIPADFSGRVIMDFADVDSAKFESYAGEGFGPMTWINRREDKLLRVF